MDSKKIIISILMFIPLIVFGCTSRGYFYEGHEYNTPPYYYDRGFYDYYPYGHHMGEEHEHHEERGFNNNELEGHHDESHVSHDRR
jgi:hypothetical protein